MNASGNAATNVVTGRCFDAGTNSGFYNAVVFGGSTDQARGSR